MRNLWSDDEAAAHPGDLATRVYSSRLLGREPALVLHGGGNTSVKVSETDVLDRRVEILYVKGSGADLATIQEDGFAPVRLAHLLALAELDELSDARMAEELRLACTAVGAPAPSVEAILHAMLPARYVDHTHADALLTLTNTPHGRRRVEEIYGERAVVVDYVMPGFALARDCSRRFAAERTHTTVGLVLMNHGLFTFGDTARESYDRMIEFVTLAEDHLRKAGAWTLPEADEAYPTPPRASVAGLRAELSQVAGAPLIVRTTRTPRTGAFLQRSDWADLATRGPLTPDHVIRTKPRPLTGRDVRDYAAGYQRYFDRQAARAAAPLTMLDPAPRVVLDRELGLLTAGRTARDAAIARDIALHTIDAVERAAILDDWQALPEDDLFDVEYWELEQAKLRRGGTEPPFAGEVALVTGAASGIGRATAEAFLRAGAAVVGLDVDERVTEREDAFADDAFLGLVCDVTDEPVLDRALDGVVESFGGLDILVLNAGVFPPSAPIVELTPGTWRRTMAVNVDANVSLLRLSADLLTASPRHGRVVVNASKNVRAPGPGAAAYSASKAALTQLARVAALEWAPRGIRVNLVHPDAVFDTGLWDEETIAARAASYGLSPEAYRTKNLLGVEITSRDVAEVIVALCSPAFARTTGAQIPVDGGNERVV